MQYELPGLDIQAGLSRMGGKREEYSNLLRKFAANRLKNVSEIKVLLSSNDIAAARHVIHTLAGVAGNIGAVSLQGAAREHEIALGGEDRDRWWRTLNAVETRFSEVSESIRLFLNETAWNDVAVGGNENIDVVRVRSLLDELKSLFEENNARSKVVFANLKKNLHDTRFSPGLRLIGRCLDNYDFDGALAALTGLERSLGA